MPSPSCPVLVVEDDNSIRDMLIENLEEAGFAAIGTPDGLEAWNQLQQGLQPCLILLDLMMPRMDGWQFRSMQLAHPDLIHIPVVILTAVRNPAEAAQRLQVQHWLPKPFNIKKVIQIVQHHCAHPDPQPPVSPSTSAQDPSA